MNKQYVLKSDVLKGLSLLFFSLIFCFGTNAVEKQSSSSLSDPILFIVREQYRQHHGTEATMCQTAEINTHFFRPGSAMKILDPQTGIIKTILETKTGLIRDPEIHFDGDKVLFSMRKNIDDDYHIYEMNVDGSNLKQLTFAPRVSDIQPIYLPDNSIVFSSTRDPKYIPCNRYLMPNMFKMDADGANIHQIGYNTQFEGRASLMPDGRILYTRWEYVDKHYAPAYGLWTVNPDGTDHALYFGGYGWQPSSISDARIIPGTDNFVGTYTAVHALAWGAIVCADRKKGMDGIEPVTHSWPSDVSQYLTHWDVEERIGKGFDSFKTIKVKYEDPFPLSQEQFLCVRQLEPKGRMAIFLLDANGEEILIHDEEPGCFDPMPVVKRERPPVIPAKSDLAQTQGTFYVQDVYIGEGMETVKKGSVKYMRVIEAPSKISTYNAKGTGDWSPHDSKDSHHPKALNWNHYNNKRILGTVPVEEDGSVNVNVPAGKFVFFQLLDKDKKMIHSMRSGTMLQGGEVKGCVGCHEDKSAAPTGFAKMPVALRKQAHDLKGWFGEPVKFSYAKEVQPVLDKHCISCHDYGKQAANFNLSGDKGIIFNMSYTNLMRKSPGEWKRKSQGEEKSLVSSVGAGPVKVLEPYSWGSTQSSLIDLLEAGHPDFSGEKRINLDKESFERIVTWIDMNCSYYPSHVSYYGNNTAARSPLNHADLKELGELILNTPNGKDYGWDKVTEYQCTQIAEIMYHFGEPVNFTRPEKSLVLTAFEDKNSTEYHRALQLIKKGAQNLKQNPRNDMPGFQPREADKEQLDFLEVRRKVEQLNKEAIVNGNKLYDKDVLKQAKEIVGY